MDNSSLLKVLLLALTGFVFGQNASQISSLILIGEYGVGSNLRQFYSINRTMNWTQSREFCSEYGLGLASINNFEDQYVILSWAFQNGEEWEAFWLNGKEEMGIWKWRDSNEPINVGGGQGFQNWADGEPAKHNTTDKCLAAYLAKSKWRSAQCTDNKRPLCSLDISTSPSTSKSIPTTTTTTSPTSASTSMATTSTPRTAGTISSTTTTLTTPRPTQPQPTLPSPQCDNNSRVLSIGGNISSCRNNRGIINIKRGSNVTSLVDNVGTITTGNECRIDNIRNNFGIIQVGDDSVVGTYTGSGIINLGMNSIIRNRQ